MPFTTALRRLAAALGRPFADAARLWNSGVAREDFARIEQRRRALR